MEFAVVAAWINAGGDVRHEVTIDRAAGAGAIELRQTVTRVSGADWTGARGRLNREALEELVHDPATLCFVCGPPALVDEMPKILTDLGIPRERIRVEEWTNLPG